MKILFNTLLFCLLSGICFGQAERPNMDFDGKPMSYAVSALNSSFPVFLKADENTRSFSPFNAIPNDPLGSIVFMEGAQSVYLSTRIKKDSIKYYRYSIVENDKKTLVSNALLTKVDFVWNNRSAAPGYVTMDFGISAIANKKLTIKMYKLSEPDKVTTVILYNKPVNPVKLIDSYLVTQGKLVKMQADSQYTNEVHPVNIPFSVSEKNKGIFISFKKTDIDFIFHIYLKHKSKNGEIFTSDLNNWNYNTKGGMPGYFINANYFNNAGDYELIIAPRVGLRTIDSLATKISFKVLAAPQSYSVKHLILIGLLVIIFLSLVVVLIILKVKKDARNKLVAAGQQVEAAKGELNMVRSQLNPHFVFNALTGIQNLMNKNEIELANGYLNKFASLTRQILNDNVLITIKDEADLLDDYLSMEQLRFLFKYEIHIDAGLPDYIEVPVMLVQPFVENAVKHGAARLKEQGEIIIRFIKQEKNIVITIADNGKGFDTAQKHDGFGLKLSKKRITLLNQVYNECPITLEINSTNSGTAINITLIQWL